MAWLISGILAALMIGLSLLLNTMYREDGAENKCFLCGILCMLCIAIKPEAILYLPLLWLTFSVLRINSLRTFLASLLGVGVVVVYMALAWWYWQDSIWMQVIEQHYIGIIHREWIILRPSWEIGLCAISTLIGAFFILHHAIVFARANVRVQTRFLILCTFFVVGLADSLYPQQGATSLWSWLVLSSLSLAILYFVHFGMPHFSHKAVYRSTHQWAHQRHAMKTSWGNRK